MKKSLLILPFAAALALSSCSKDDTLDNEAIADGNDGRFLAVSIVPNLTGGTRADYNDTEGSTFEDGTATENEIKGVRLYFFNASGDPVRVKKGSANFYDIPMDDIENAGFGEADHSETVEKTIKAVVIVESGERLPAQVVAIVNPNPDFLTNDIATWAELKEYVSDYAGRINNPDKKYGTLFTMVNSVYANGKEVVSTTTVTPDKYAKSAADAKKNPVQIYVERNVAKVRAKISEDLKKSKIGVQENAPLQFPVKRLVNSKEEDYTFTDAKGKKTQVYVNFYGWDVTATLPYAYISKHINASWPYDYLGTNAKWNAPEYHRSYWAAFCNGGTGKDNINQYFSYDDATKFKATKFDGTENVYCNENAERSVSGSDDIHAATKVIIKAEICDGDGNPLHITEYAGNRGIDDANFSTLKARYLLMLKGNRAGMPWKEIANEDGTKTYREMEADDLSFMTATAAGGLNDDKSGTYYVYACMSETAKNYTWYSKINIVGGTITVNEADKIADLKVIDADLKAQSRAKIWNGGKTHYFADIKHIGRSIGVVRNHIYDINLTKIYGLGTPAYDPEEVIIPEKPQDEDTYVAAQINILSWRVVNNDVALDWND